MIFHKFFDPEVVADPNPDIVLPDDWNKDHAHPAQVVIDWREATTPGDSWINMPVTLEAFFQDRRTYAYCDLRFAVEARLIVEMMVAGASGAELRAQYSSNGGTSWNYLAASNGPKQTISAIGIFASAWAAIVAGAKIENSLVRIVGINGNAVIDPKFMSVTLQVR